MNPPDVWPSTYFDLSVENNDKDPKFKVVDHVGISQHFCMGAVQIGQETFLSLKRSKILHDGRM